MKLPQVLMIALALVALVPKHLLAQAPKANPADEFYQGDVVQSVHLRIDPADIERMHAALPQRISVPASFRWRDQIIDKVSVRFKGNSSSSKNQKHKRSYLVRFNEFDGDQRFLGLRRVSFDNGIQFGSVFSEPIVTKILRDLDVTTHRCNYARLFVNDQYQGVYLNVERIDESFLENHLPDPQGLLFKVDEGGPGADLQFLGDDPEVYRHAFEAETKSAKKGYQQLIELLRFIHQTKDDDFAAKLDAKLELDPFLRTTAVLLLAGAFDQLTGWSPHNYYLYQDRKSGRWTYLPWDLDVGFSEVAFGRIHVLRDWNAAWPLAGQLPNPLLERIVSDPALLKRYREIARDILERHFEPRQLSAAIDARYALIKDDLEQDPFPRVRVTNPSDRNYDDIVASMKRFFQTRYDTARKQLDEPGERPPLARRPEGPPHPLAAKIQRIQRLAEQKQRAGGDVSPIAKIMQKVGPLLRDGQTKEAEQLIDEALKLAEAR